MLFVSLQLDSEQKEQFIADLLQNCKGIRLDTVGQMGLKDLSGEAAAGFAAASSKEPQMPLPESVDDIQVRKTDRHVRV